MKFKIVQNDLPDKLCVNISDGINKHLIQTIFSCKINIETTTNFVLRINWEVRNIIYLREHIKKKVDNGINQYIPLQKYQLN